MVRVPATIIGLLLTLLADLVTLVAARYFDLLSLPIVLLPIAAAAGGLVAGRWSLRLPPVPGFAVGLLTLAVRVGLGLGFGLGVLAFVDPIIGLLEMIAAITGGVLGALLARRQHQRLAGPELLYE